MSYNVCVSVELQPHRYWFWTESSELPTNEGWKSLLEPFLTIAKFDRRVLNWKKCVFYYQTFDVKMQKKKKISVSTNCNVEKNADLPLSVL